MIPKKLRKQLEKRGIKIKNDKKLFQKHVKENILSGATVGWFDCREPNTIYLVKRWFWYKSPDIITTILHEYRHWLQFHRNKLIWDSNRAAECDADKYAERTIKYFN